MDRETVSVAELLHYTNSGWMVAWIGREDNLLLVDLFANWRLQDGKFFFVRCKLPKRGLAGWLVSVQQQWEEEIAEWISNLSRTTAKARDG